MYDEDRNKGGGFIHIQWQSLYTCQCSWYCRSVYALASITIIFIIIIILPTSTTNILTRSPSTLSVCLPVETLPPLAHIYSSWPLSLYMQEEGASWCGHQKGRKKKANLTSDLTYYSCLYIIQILCRYIHRIPSLLLCCYPSEARMYIHPFEMSHWATCRLIVTLSKTF